MPTVSAATGREGDTSRSIDGRRLLRHLHTFGEIGRSPAGILSRVALTDEDRAGRDQLVRWMAELSLDVAVDAIGNIFGTWRPPSAEGDPVMIGSHADTVIDAGIYDGAYGILAGLEVVRVLRASGLKPVRPLTVAAFTNEEGVRYAPDMMGSLVYAGALDMDAALNVRGTDGSRLRDELERIGYRGSLPPETLQPHAFVELHIEQGPVLEQEGIWVGAVEGVQAISWQRITLEGQANHAGTTPMELRRDAGAAAGRIMNFLPTLAQSVGHGTVATAGTVQLEPNAVNVVPGRAVLSVDVRNPTEELLVAAERNLQEFVKGLADERGLRTTFDRLARTSPVEFNGHLIERIEVAGRKRGHATRRMVSGAGHDAQMMARVAPTAMIFVPSQGGLSHCPEEHTAPEHLTAGANVLLDVVTDLVLDEAAGLT